MEGSQGVCGTLWPGCMLCLRAGNDPSWSFRLILSLPCMVPKSVNGNYSMSVKGSSNGKGDKC